MDKTPKANVVFASGGTGGHIYPALETADELQRNTEGICIQFYGSGGETESRILKESIYEHVVVSSSAVVGKGFSGLFLFVWAFLKKTKYLISKYRKDGVKLIIGYGGYPSVIPVVSAYLAGIPIFLFEQNGKVGLANNTLRFLATKRYCVRATTGPYRKGAIIVRNPVRKSLKNVPGFIPPAQGEKVHIAIIGGSQGAVSLNTLVADAIEGLDQSRVSLRHQVGPKDKVRMESRYKEIQFGDVVVSSFVDDMRDLYSWAHLVICRAGASTAAELRIVLRPAVFVPLPISRGHQKLNIIDLCEQGGCQMIEHGPHDVECLRSLIGNIQDKPSILAEWHRQMCRYEMDFPDPDGSEEIASAAIKLLQYNSE